MASNPWETIWTGKDTQGPWEKAFGDSKGQGSWEKAFSGDAWGNAFKDAPMP